MPEDYVEYFHRVCHLLYVSPHAFVVTRSQTGLLLERAITAVLWHAINFLWMLSQSESPYVTLDLSIITIVQVNLGTDIPFQVKGLTGRRLMAGRNNCSGKVESKGV